MEDLETKKDEDEESGPMFYEGAEKGRNVQGSGI